MPSFLFRSTLVAAFLSAFVITNAHADGANEPIPTYYQEAGLSRNSGYLNQHANEHIDRRSDRHVHANEHFDRRSDGDVHADPSRQILKPAAQIRRGA